MVALFEQEAELCRRTVNPEIDRNYPANFSNYILNLFKRQGLGRELESAAEEVGQGNELVFY